MSDNVIPFAPRSGEPELTKKQLAEALEVSERWIEYRMKEGLPRIQWTARMIRFRESECRHWLATRRQAS